MKKLIPAIALLVISSLLLSVASYAWFSMNTTVSATNMSVKATTSKNLVIKLSETPDTPLAWNQSVSAATTLTSMLPVSTSDLTNWFTTTEQGKAKVDFNTGVIAGAAEGDFAAATNPVGGTTGFYYLKKSFDIKVSAEGAASYSSLYVSDITISVPSTLNISKSIRVGVMIGATFFIYTPNGGQTSYDAITATDGTPGAVTAYSAYTDARDLGAVDADGVTADVYIWYEGQDTNNTSFNAMDSEAVEFAISFKAVE